MTKGMYRYAVSVELTLTLEEVEYLRFIAANHYDAECQQTAEQGGFLWGFKKTLMVAPNKSQFVLDSHQLDILCKILEIEQHVRKLRLSELPLMAHNIQQILRDLIGESNRINKHWLRS